MTAFIVLASVVVSAACVELVEIGTLDGTESGDSSGCEAGPSVCFSEVEGTPGAVVTSEVLFRGLDQPPRSCTSSLHQVDGLIRISPGDVVELLNVEPSLTACVQRVPLAGEGINYLLMSGEDCGPWSAGLIDTLELRIDPAAEPGVYTLATELAIQSPGGAGSGCDFNQANGPATIRVTVVAD